MARITQQQKEENLSKFNKIIIDIFLNEGWHAVTYDNIAKIAGVRKSTLQGYYETHRDFGNAMKGQIFPVFIKHLDFSSRDRIIESWISALEDRVFRNILTMMISNASSDTPNEMTVIGVGNLQKLFVQQLGQEGSDILERLLGKTVMSLLKL